MNRLGWTVGIVLCVGDCLIVERARNAYAEIINFAERIKNFKVILKRNAEGLAEPLMWIHFFPFLPFSTFYCVVNSLFYFGVKKNVSFPVRLARIGWPAATIPFISGWIEMHETNKFRFTDLMHILIGRMSIFHSNILSIFPFDWNRFQCINCTWRHRRISIIAFHVHNLHSHSFLYVSCSVVRLGWAGIFSQGERQQHINRPSSAKKKNKYVEEMDEKMRRGNAATRNWFSCAWRRRGRRSSDADICWITANAFFSNLLNANRIFYMAIIYLFGPKGMRIRRICTEFGIGWPERDFSPFAPPPPNGYSIVKMLFKIIWNSK